MTPEEAINWCEQFENNIIACDVETKRRTLALQTMQVAKSALEKQIPKKPIPKIVDVDKIKIGNASWCKGTTIYHCPNCKDYISRIYKRCHNCGQALDWSEEDGSIL